MIFLLRLGSFPARQIAATGQETLEELEELEIIFGAVSELGGLERCTSLRSLTRECRPRLPRATHYVQRLRLVLSYIRWGELPPRVINGPIESWVAARVCVGLPSVPTLKHEYDSAVIHTRDRRTSISCRPSPDAGRAGGGISSRTVPPCLDRHFQALIERMTVDEKGQGLSAPPPSLLCAPTDPPDTDCLLTVSVIDCGLRRISNLEPVGHSLVKMCLCDQVCEVVFVLLFGTIVTRECTLHSCLCHGRCQLKLFRHLRHEILCGSLFGLVLRRPCFRRG